MARRDAVIRLLGDADALMEELERLNLAGRKSVPPRLIPRLVAFHAVVIGVAPAPDHETIGATQAALDALYDAAEIVLQWRRRERGLVAAHDPGEVEGVG